MITPHCYLGLHLHVAQNLANCNVEQSWCKDTALSHADVVWRRFGIIWLRRTWAPVISWNVAMNSRRASGMPRPCSVFHKAALMSRYATFSGRSNSRCRPKSDNRRNAIVERLATKPDSNSGRRFMSTNCCRPIRARNTFAKTLPGTDSNVNKTVVNAFWPGAFAMYSAIKVPYLQSEGVRPDLHTWINCVCKALATGLVIPLSPSSFYNISLCENSQDVKRQTQKQSRR